MRQSVVLDIDCVYRSTVGETVSGIGYRLCVQAYSG